MSSDIDGEVIANKANCRALVEADLAQAIREVLLSDEFMTAFAAAWMKTPLPLSMHFDDKDGEPILIDGLTPVWRTPEATINNTILPEAKPAKLDLADRTLKAIWQANDPMNEGGKQ